MDKIVAMLPYGRRSASGSSSTIRALTLACLLVQACTGASPSVRVAPDRSIASRWLFLDEPLKNSVEPGFTWTGTSVGTDCFSVTKVFIDTTGTEVVDVGSTSTNVSLATKIAHVVGLSGAATRVQSWRIEGRHARVAVAQDLVPSFLDSCQPKTDGVPRYPAIAELLAFDSLIVSRTDSAGNNAALDAGTISKLVDTLHFKVETKDGRSVVSRTGNTWVAWHLVGVRPADTKTWRVRPGAVGMSPCDGGTECAYSVAARRLASGGRFELTSQNTGQMNAPVRVDTVGVGQVVTLGVSRNLAGTTGEWFTISARPIDAAGTPEVTIVRHGYKTVRFMSEQDRTSLDAFLR